LLLHLKIIISGIGGDTSEEKNQQCAEIKIVLPRAAKCGAF
jgi:hypothetical protein